MTKFNCSASKRSFKDKIDKYSYDGLVAKSKKNAAIGRALRLAAEENKGLVRYMLRDEKRTQAPISRRYLWVLAFFRGRTLDSIEPKRDPENELGRQCVIDAIVFFSKPGYARTWSKELRKNLYSKIFIEDINRFFGEEVLKEEAPAKAPPAPGGFKQESKSEAQLVEGVV